MPDLEREREREREREIERKLTGSKGNYFTFQKG
jgi:hypothetical protein